MSFNNFDEFSFPFTEEKDYDSVLSHFRGEPMPDLPEQIREIENKCNYIQNIYTIEEDSVQIYNNFQIIKDIIPNEEDINEKKEVYFEENDEKEIKYIEIENEENKENKKDEVKKIIINKKPENESNIIPFKNKKK